MKYPTRRNGIAVPPAEIGFRVPTPEELNIRGLTSVHHLYFPRPRFEDPIASVFRSLEPNTTRMLAPEHNLGRSSLHSRYKEGLQRPPLGVMIDVIDEYLCLNGVIVCVKEHQTRETYRIHEKEWRHKLRTYRSKNAKF